MFAYPRLLLAAALATGLIGCSGGARNAATPADQPAQASLDLLDNPLFNEVRSSGKLSGFANLGGATFTLDPVAGTAETTPLRGVAQTDDTYLLSLENFFKARHIRITGVTSTVDDLSVSYRVEHPFPAPRDYMLPPNAGDNRADLGFSGRLVFLTDVPTATGNTYFTNVVANTSLFRNMDGYIQPKDTLPQASSMTANAFPFKLLVDEALGPNGNRVGISNVGSPRGNYRSLDGWQRSNGGSNRDSWSGFDVFHQGQKATNSFTIRKSAMAGGAYSFSAVVLVKYIDPRGGTSGLEKRGNRLPAELGDVTKFVYRMPYGAFDVSKATFRGEAGGGGLIPNDPLTSTTVRFTARDWDARAIATTFPDLSQDPSPGTIEANAFGVPGISLDIPGVTTSPVSMTLSDDDSPIGGDPAVPETGESNDPLYYEAIVLNSGGVGGQVAGTVTGLARITDVTNAVDRSAYEIPVRPDLSPITDPLLKPAVEIFQRFEVGLGGIANDPPSATVSLVGGPNPTIATLGNVVFQLDAEADTESDTVLYDIDVAYSGSFVADVTGVDPAAPVSTIYTGTAPNNGGVTNLMVEARVRYYDAAHVGVPIEVILPYEVAPAGANLPPTAVLELQGGPNPTIPSGGTLVFLLQSETDPDLDAVNYEIMYDYGGVFTPDVPAFDPAGTPPLTLNTSPAQTNPGPGPVARVARIQYWDPLRAGSPIVQDLIYNIADPACSLLTQTYTFPGSDQGWVGGQVWGVPNGDATSYGNFSQVTTCTNGTVEAASGGLMNGNYWGCSWDVESVFGACAFIGDYGSNADYNIVSPLLTVPVLCGALQVSLTYDLMLASRVGSTVQVYTSTNEGCTWVAQGSPVVAIATPPAQLAANTSVTFTGISAGQKLLVRIQFRDPGGSYFDPVGLGFVGAWIDNIRLEATSAGAWTPATPTPPPPTYFTDDFSGPNNWSAFGLPQTDRATVEGGACGDPGPWASWAICNPTQSIAGWTNPVMTLGSDFGNCTTFTGDMCDSSDFNIVSPLINLATATATSVISFAEWSGAAGSPPTTNVYMAISPAMGDLVAWGAPVFTKLHILGETPGSTTLQFPIPPAYLGMANVRFRIQVTTPVGAPFPDVCSDYTWLATSNTGQIGFDNFAIAEPRCP